MIFAPTLPSPSKDYPETIDNHGVIEELTTIRERLSSDEAADRVAPIDNRENLQQLELEKDKLSNLITSIGAASLIAGLATFSVAWLGILLTWKPATRLEKVSRLIKLIKNILEEFEGLGVEALPLIKVPGYQPIDLFVRFPGKEFLLFAIRSFGESKIIYNEHKQALYYRRSKKGLKRWEPDPLTELSEQAYWLRKNRRNLFGNSRGVRKPMAKVLVVWNQTNLDEHQEHLYTTIGGKKFLFIPREGGACYVIHSSQVIDFIRAWLAHRQSQDQTT
ncbi:hypothetical protein [Leptolyngbya sp. FACHB-16]|uniref:hypothetical protein n=1 Tax=unclassified Leptolyngbya TaxID=2650499 RepID=UPI001681DF1C|nr:hypothetical protein [Leptolyngbya sp. FACHB-16]MBD2157320.1 hypothetical protein [Leptolyngbya sp. FACHB-16]